jgi:hypothetical protein
MPGNKLYVARQFLEQVQEFWYFGDMSKVKYHIKMADKYLVEAKTLFEYKQIKLGEVSLSISNDHFAKAVLYERDVAYEKKDKGEQEELLKNSGHKHSEIINLLMKDLPEKINWQEEKKDSETIWVHMILKQALIIRQYATR